MAHLTTATDWLQFDLFKDFSLEEVEDIRSHSQVRYLGPEEVLIHPQQPNDTLYLLARGTVQIILQKDEQGTPFTVPIEEGECLGEMSLLMDKPTSALVMTLEDCEVLCIPEQVFWEKIMSTRKGVRNLMGQMAARLQNTNQIIIRQVEEQLALQHLQRDLETAGRLQADIVPDGSQLLPNHPQVDAFALIDQARAVGGDFYDAIALDEEHVFLTVGDVSGKGMPAALFMVRAFTFLRLVINAHLDLDEGITSLNRWLAHNNEHMMFITLFAGVLNLRTGQLSYINAGHNPPFLSTGGGPYELTTLSTSPIVGVVDDAQFRVQQATLAPGDTWVLYTDGITEATNKDQVMFEVEGVEAVLNQREWHNMSDLIQTLCSSVEAFVGESPQHDDYTLFAFRYVG